MEKFKGTQGPWIASDYYSDATTIIDGSGFSIADAPRCLIHEGWPDKGLEHWADSPDAHRWISEEEQRANANLIAAAPDLLEALQSAVDILDNLSWAPDTSVMHAAIARALGKNDGDK